MTTITREQQKQILIDTANHVISRDNTSPYSENLRELARIALASLEAEPVGEFYEYKPGDWYQRSIGDKAPKWVPLYATPPVPELQADVAQAIENLKQKLVECNRYNYCADAVKGVEDACRAVSYSQADNQPASGNQAAESNRGNEWTGNPDIDNAIIMLDRIDTLESCDDDRIEAVKAVLRRLAGNSPVTPDGWISCSERMPDNDESKPIAIFTGKCLGQGMFVATYDDDGFFDYWEGMEIIGVSHWMPLPAAPEPDQS
ncbi:DUF551 domain-containing protein [Salmonella enterica]|uniref:DUF551 domain-containing protein n=1 Tax=Salmonella enterica TaxID=28901 RepID=UPI0009ADA108|nr:DUF551 domain-containing protein [Salmonella enterica]EDC0805243.1 DUF551 domain-containing protein [Salmonella enterica subsp. enterica serovar Senftenberg]EEG4388224.1 DUF551 domain-containing protein [Salmonella enterica subsp. enterica serovar Meleagridis]